MLTLESPDVVLTLHDFHTAAKDFREHGEAGRDAEARLARERIDHARFRLQALVGDREARKLIAKKKPEEIEAMVATTIEKKDERAVDRHANTRRFTDEQLLDALRRGVPRNDFAARFEVSRSAVDMRVSSLKKKGVAIPGSKEATCPPAKSSTSRSSGSPASSPRPARATRPARASAATASESTGSAPGRASPKAGARAAAAPSSPSSSASTASPIPSGPSETHAPPIAPALTLYGALRLESEELLRQVAASVSDCGHMDWLATALLARAVARLTEAS
jgi:cobalamin biosynthesis Mg chelatase CobN